jgi:hypothetical protein
MLEIIMKYIIIIMMFKHKKEIKPILVVQEIMIEAGLIVLKIKIKQAHLR